MTADVLAEATLRNVEARDRYLEAVRPVLKQFGGEFLAFGPWHVLYGEPAYERHDCYISHKHTALAWYNSPAYQALLGVRDEGHDSRFRLIG